MSLFCQLFLHNPNLLAKAKKVYRTQNSYIYRFGLISRTIYWIHKLYFSQKKDS